MSAADPGLSLKASTLGAALAQLAPALGATFEAGAPAPSSDPAEALEALALPAGWRPRRVLLDGAWWKEPAVPMLARVAERRRLPRDDPWGAPSAARETGTGWVALIPGPGGYRMRAGDAERGAAEWLVDARVAQRLAPFAFTFHRRFAARPVRVRDLLHMTFAEGRRDLAALALAGAAAAALGLLVPIAMGWMVDSAIPAGALGRIGALVAALGAAGLAVVCLEMLRALAAMRFEARVAVALQAALVDRVVGAPARFFRAFSTGDLALRIGAVNTVQRTLAGASLGAFVTALFVAANLALMLRYSAQLTAAALGIVALAVAISAALGAARLRLGPRIEALDGRLGATTFELFAGIAKLRAAAAEPRAFARWAQRYAQFRAAAAASARLSNWETVLLSLLQPLATALVLALAWRLAAQGALSTGAFVAFHAALFALLGGVQSLVTIALTVANLRPAWQRARPILDAVSEDAGGGERHDPAGAIALEGVGFAYPGGPEVLHGIDLRVAPGEFVALVGASGSGKSTLLRLLLGFERPARGTVRYDGRDLATLDVRHLRRRIGTVLQDGKLWAGDLHTNIVGAADVGADAAWEAARRAGLARDIEAMPMGLYTVVGEGLSTLSGGQRQRVLIARALVGAPRLLFLDEATSALDNVSQAAVLAALEGLEATRIVIAHRLGSVRNADRIVVLDAGRIVQQGRFEELAAQAGPFAQLLARQVA